MSKLEMCGTWPYVTYVACAFLCQGKMACHRPGLLAMLILLGAAGSSGSPAPLEKSY